MIVFAVYLTVFLPLLYATAQLRALRGAKAGYRRFMLLCFTVLLAAGFLVAPVAAIGMLLLLGAAVHTTAKELRYRHRTVQYQRGNIPRPPAPLRGAA